jgi:hypothetical protein
VNKRTPYLGRDGHCERDGCDKKIKARRLCQYHYHKDLYPRYRDRPNVVLKKQAMQEISSEELWDLIAKDIANGSIVLSEWKTK